MLSLVGNMESGEGDACMLLASELESITLPRLKDDRLQTLAPASCVAAS